MQAEGLGVDFGVAPVVDGMQDFFNRRICTPMTGSGRVHFVCKEDGADAFTAVMAHEIFYRSGISPVEHRHDEAAVLERDQQWSIVDGAILIVVEEFGQYSGFVEYLYWP